MKLPALFAAAILAAATQAAWAADPLDSRIDGLAAAWAHANYEVHDPAAEATEVAKVAAQAAAVAQQYPGRAEPLVWQAIATATEGGVKGGLGGLALAKEARGLLEKAEKLNPNALDGSIYTTLGSLYAQVPGFPIGFGDAAKAKANFAKALAINPTGVDANFFYGDFLIRQGDYAGAVKALERAANAPARPGREVADRGRHAETLALLAKARAKLHG